MTTALRIRDRRLAHCHLVLLEGEIDLGSSPRLQTRLTTAIALAEEPILLEVSGVRFCDAAGLNVFAHAVKDAEARSVPLHLVGLSGRLGYVFTLTGLDLVLPVHPDLRQALRALQAAGAAPLPADGPPARG